MMSGINKAAKLGIIVKSSASMEQIGKAEAVLFDKTGTITFGTPVVEKIVAINSTNPDDLLMKAASVEQLSSHPGSKSIGTEGSREIDKNGNAYRFPRNPRCWS